MEVYIHVGYPKNASTTLQTDIFPTFKNALYIGRKYDSGESFGTKELTKAFYDLTMYDSIDCDLESIKKLINTYIDNQTEKYEKLVISSEAFSSNMADRLVMAERLKTLFPNAKIMIVIREQMNALRSMYAFLVLQRGLNVNISYGRPSIASFEKWIIEQENILGRSFITTLKYFEYISMYKKLFGNDSVAVFLFEELVRFPEVFYKKLGKFCGEDLLKNISAMKVPTRNKGLKSHATTYYRLRAMLPNVSLSKYIPKVVVLAWRNFLNKDIYPDKKEYLPPEIERALSDLYRANNKMLVKDININISEYGYLV